MKKIYSLYFVGLVMLATATFAGESHDFSRVQVKQMDNGDYVIYGNVVITRGMDRPSEDICSIDSEIIVEGTKHVLADCTRLTVHLKVSQKTHYELTFKRNDLEVGKKNGIVQTSFNQDKIGKPTGCQ